MPYTAFNAPHSIQCPTQVFDVANLGIATAFVAIQVFDVASLRIATAFVAIPSLPRTACPVAKNVVDFFSGSDFLLFLNFPTLVTFSYYGLASAHNSAS
jgi:hypothetical protein